eukprot:m.4381 g.4381  ORF g.4381 m.4381 type:complete len:343 (-) comp4298_c0_seq1:65-1093(-)
MTLLAFLAIAGTRAATLRTAGSASCALMRTLSVGAICALDAGDTPRCTLVNVLAAGPASSGSVPSLASCARGQGAVFAAIFAARMAGHATVRARSIVAIFSHGACHVRLGALVDILAHSAHIFIAALATQAICVGATGALLAARIASLASLTHRIMRFCAFVARLAAKAEVARAFSVASASAITATGPTIAADTLCTAGACSTVLPERADRAAQLCVLNTQPLCQIPTLSGVLSPPLLDHLFHVGLHLGAKRVALRAYMLEDLDETCLTHGVLAQKLFLVECPALRVAPTEVNGLGCLLLTSMKLLHNVPACLALVTARITARCRYTQGKNQRNQQYALHGC